MLFVRGCKLRAPLYSLEVSSSDLGFGPLPNDESPQKKKKPNAFTFHGLMVSSVSRVCQCFWCLFKELTNLTLALCLIVVKELHLHRRGAHQPRQQFDDIKYIMAEEGLI